MKNMKNNTEESDKENYKKNRRTTLALMAFALFVALLLQLCSKHYEKEAIRFKYAEEKQRLDSIQRADSLQRIADSLKILDSLQQRVHLADSLKLDSLLRDSLYNDSLQKAQKRSQEDSAAALARKLRQDSLRHADSLQKIEDSLQSIADSLEALRASDTIPPTGQLLPPQGRYYEDISLRIQCDEPKCKKHIAIEDTLKPQLWTSPISHNKTGLVWWQLEDSVGNKSSWQSVAYDMAADNRCSKNSFPVPVSGGEICVDAYEYPNEAGAIPRDMVSQSEAVKLCEEQGKYLCNIEEWQAACKGKDNLRYPYGNRYDQTRCATAQKEAERSGRKESCRSWWGMSDMSGNLWEWTSSPYTQRAGFFLVTGGAWNTADGSSCSEVKYSFYPQNQYPFVGFRCCSKIK